MVDQAIQHALESDPSKRFQSAADMREALQAALREPELLRRRRRRMAFAALGALTLALGAAIAAGASRPEVRERAAAMAKPLLERIRPHKPATEAAAGVAPASEAAQAAMPEPAAPTSAGDPDEEGADPALMAEDSDEMPVAGALHEGEPEPEDQAGSDDAKDRAGSDDSAGKDAESVASRDQSRAPASDSASTPPDHLEEKLAEAVEIMKNGRKLKGFNEIRRLGRKHMKDPRALKAWSEAAVMMNGWGEAHRVAERWAKVDQGVEARIHLARMQRAVGKRDAAVKTLSRLLEQHPDSGEARGMLRSYQGSAVALRH